MTHCGALVVGHDVLSVFSLSHDSLEGGGFHGSNCQGINKPNVLQ